MQFLLLPLEGLEGGAHGDSPSTIPLTGTTNVYKFTQASLFPLLMHMPVLHRYTRGRNRAGIIQRAFFCNLHMCFLSGCSYLSFFTFIFTRNKHVNTAKIKKRHLAMRLCRGFCSLPLSCKSAKKIKAPPPPAEAAPTSSRPELRVAESKPLHSGHTQRQNQRSALKPHIPLRRPPF